jgi:hypothetical protein
LRSLSRRRCGGYVQLLRENKTIDPYSRRVEMEEIEKNDSLPQPALYSANQSTTRETADAKSSSTRLLRLLARYIEQFLDSLPTLGQVPAFLRTMIRLVSLLAKQLYLSNRVRQT